MHEEELKKKLNLLDQLQSACTGCGICSEACATFQVSGWEHESPRGRLHLAAQFLHGHIHPQSSALSTFDHCLGCQSCENLCPHQVSYHQVRQLVQELRGDLNTPQKVSSMKRSQYRRWMTLAYRIGKWWWREYGWKWLKIPIFSSNFQGSFIKKQISSQIDAPVLAVCCVQDLIQHSIIEQTLTFMESLEQPLKVDKHQPCCGAIFERLIHGGEESVFYLKDQKKAISYQQRCLKSFLNWLSPVTYFLSKGCECFISKYTSHELDLYIWIEKLLKQKQTKLFFPTPCEVYYQPYCGSLISIEKDAIWRLLNQIQGLTVHLISSYRSCCGGYCGEALLHSDQAYKMANKKLLSLPLGATVLVTSPDCWGAFKACQTNQQLTFLYPIEILIQAKRANFSHKYPDLQGEKFKTQG